MANILLAEDDDSMARFLCAALERAGHTVTVHSDGLSALEMLDSTDHYDLLLTDIVMPGMDGIELSRKASDKRPQMKVMFITGFAAVAMANAAQEDKTKILSKPFHLNDLVSQVESLLAA